MQRACNWAAEMGFIENTPLKKVAKPPARRRDNPMAPTDFEAMLGKLNRGDPFRDLFLFVWHSGCRPQEARHIEARHAFIETESIVIPKEEAKGKRRARVILLHGPALEIIRRLVKRRKQGKLFRNTRGQPWSKYAVCNRVYRLSRAAGKPFALYDARHGYCQRLLEAGVNMTAVAELMGHANAMMVSSVYSHMNKATARLKEALRKADPASREKALED